MVSPTADAGEPGLETLKFIVAEFGVEFFQQEYGGNFLFQHRTREEIICNLDQKIEPVFFPDFTPKTERSAAQGGCGTRSAGRQPY